MGQGEMHIRKGCQDGEIMRVFNLTGPDDLDPDSIVAELIDMCERAAETNVIRVIDFDRNPSHGARFTS